MKQFLKLWNISTFYRIPHKVDCELLGFCCVWVEEKQHCGFHLTWLSNMSKIKDPKGKRKEKRRKILDLLLCCCEYAPHLLWMTFLDFFFSILLLIKTSSAQINQGIKKTWKTSLLDYFHIDVKDKVSTNYTSALKMNDEFWPAARLHKAFSFFPFFFFIIVEE